MNQRLKDAKVRVRLRQRGGMLSLVATLPPKPSDPRPYQQTIAIGVSASEAGLKRAEAEARRLGAAIGKKTPPMFCCS